MSRPVRPSVSKVRDGLPNPWMTAWTIRAEPLTVEARYFASHRFAMQCANRVARELRQP